MGEFGRLVIEEEEDKLKISGEISVGMAIDIMVFMADVIAKESGVPIIEVGAWLLKTTKEMSKEEELDAFRAKIDQVMKQGEPKPGLLN